MSYIPIPSGSLQAFAGSTAPNGWLLCDGSAVSRTIYGSLFANISTLWGVGDGSTTFNLPDLRGAFVRGVGTSGVHVGPATVGSVQTHATAKNGLANSSSSISGTAAAGSCTGSTGAADRAVYASNGNKVNQAFSTFSAAGYSSGDNIDNVTAHVHSFTGSTSATSVSGTAAAQTITGDTETRPNSRGVQYIIKI